MSDNLFRLLGLQLFERDLTQTARITGMSLVDLFFSLLACYLNLLSVDDDNIVAAVYVRRVDRFLLTAKDGSNLGRKSAERLAFCIDETGSALSTGILLLADSKIVFDILKRFSFGSRTASPSCARLHNHAILVYSKSLANARLF